MKKNFKIAIIDYRAGNLFSVQHACKVVGLKPKITSDKEEILEARAAILPGVGAFGEAMNNLKKLDLIGPIRKFILSGKPFMGICLGMQLLFSGSEEFGFHKGLDIIKGKVLRFPEKSKQDDLVRVPQIGWNSIYSSNKNKWEQSYLKDTKQGEFMYFVHSYYCLPSNRRDILCLTDYSGLEYCSGVGRKNIFATQFHPEKSGQEGIKIYRNWALAVKRE